MGTSGFSLELSWPEPSAHFVHSYKMGLDLGLNKSRSPNYFVQHTETCRRRKEFHAVSLLLTRYLLFRGLNTWPGLSVMRMIVDEKFRHGYLGWRYGKLHIRVYYIFASKTAPVLRLCQRGVKFRKATPTVVVFRRVKQLVGSSRGMRLKSLSTRTWPTDLYQRHVRWGGAKRRTILETVRTKFLPKSSLKLAAFRNLATSYFDFGSQSSFQN